MIRYYKKSAGKALMELDQPEEGCWISVYPPYKHEELTNLSNHLAVPIDYFIDSLDVDEQSRYEREEGTQFLVVNIPIANEQMEEHEPNYVTIPIGIIEMDDFIVTISGYKNLVIEHFLKNDPSRLDTNDHSLFVLLFFERTVNLFINLLKHINQLRNSYEKELYNSIRNTELSKLMQLQKSLVYFLTTLRDNELMMRKMQRTNFLKVAHREEENDFFEDIIIDMSQAKEMAQIYTDILNATMEAFASIISNNMNTIMKRLTSITIVLMVPTLVASFYGMNVPLWGESNPYAFMVIILFAVGLTALIVWFFMQKRLF